MKKRLFRSAALVAALFTLLGLAACNGGTSSKSVSSDEAYPMEAYVTEASYDSDISYSVASSNGTAMAVTAESMPDDEAITADAATRKIIYDASLEVVAAAPQAAADAVILKAGALGGYVAESYSYSDDDGVYRVYVSIRVPSESLDSLVTEAEATGKVESYSLSSNDITMSYYDIAARLESAKAEEQQLLLVLAQCETVEDILLVRESLSAVREDIESYQARINTWDNLVSYATLSLSVSRTPRSVASAEENTLISLLEASEVGEAIVLAFRNSARFVVNAVYVIGIGLGYAILPCTLLFLVIGLPIILCTRAKRRKRAKMAAALAEAQAVPQGETATGAAAESQAANGQDGDRQE